MHFGLTKCRIKLRKSRCAELLLELWFFFKDGCVALQGGVEDFRQRGKL